MVSSPPGKTLNMPLPSISYSVEEIVIKELEVEYERVNDGYRLFVPNTKAATELIINHPQVFVDYEVTKGKMDDVFLCVTGKKIIGGEVQ